MSQQPAPPSQEIRPLARVLFGWTFGPRAGSLTAFALGGLGFVVIAAEAIQRRAGLRLPYEEEPGFYAAVGAGGVIALLVVAFALRALFAREEPEEGRDGDHA